MRKTLLTVGLALVCAISAPAQEEHSDWVADFDQAVTQARKEGKDLLVDFTGSDWCGWCIKLHNEVFAHAEFLEPAKEKFVLVALDFPRGDEAMARVPSPQRNEELSQKYHVHGFPTVLLMTPEGEVFGRTGYQEGGPEKYVRDLNALVHARKANLAKVKDLAAAYATAEDKAPALKQAIALLVEMDSESAGLNAAVDLVHKALEFDPDNRKGLRLPAVKALLGVGQSDYNLVDAALVMDPRNEQGLYELAVQATANSVSDIDALKAAVAMMDKYAAQDKVQNKALARDLFIKTAFWCTKFLDDAPKAKKYAQMAKDLGGLDPQALEFLNSILQPTG